MIPVIRWDAAARLGLSCLSPEDLREVADRWCGEYGSEREVDFRLEIPSRVGLRLASEPRRIRIRAITPPGVEEVEVRVGPHAVVLGAGADSDRIRLSSRRSPSSTELALLIDLGVNHLLARQGLPVLHSCAFDLSGVSVVGLGDSFSGKTTVSVAAMRAGGRVVSDDSVLAAPGVDGRVVLIPVRSYGWLRGRTREIIPSELREKMVENQENGRPRWVLNRADGGGHFVERSMPDAVWVQSIDRRLNDSRIEPVDHGQVFAALIRASSPLYLSSHCPETRGKLIPFFRSICAQCRGYRVRLGRRLLEDPEGEMERLTELSRE